MQQAYFDFRNVFYDEDIRFTSPAKVIGKHEWRIVIYQMRDYRVCGDLTKGTRFTYQWRRTGFTYAGWEQWEKWPTYNANDGMYDGCPKSLQTIKKEFDQQIAKALGLKLNEKPTPQIATQTLPLFEMNTG